MPTELVAMLRPDLTLPNNHSGVLREQPMVPGAVPGGAAEATG